MGKGADAMVGLIVVAAIGVVTYVVTNFWKRETTTEGLQQQGGERRRRNPNDDDDDDDRFPGGPPEIVCCSRTGRVMVDPVTASDGHNYERAAIEELLRERNPISPKTGKPFAHRMVIGNVQIRELASGYRDATNPDERQ